MQEMLFDPWVGKISWRKKWQLTSVATSFLTVQLTSFLTEEFHRQRSLGATVDGVAELDMTK